MTPEQRAFVMGAALMLLLAAVVGLGIFFWKSSPKDPGIRPYTYDLSGTDGESGARSHTTPGSASGAPAVSPSKEATPRPAAKSVVINGRPLSDAELDAIKEQYGQFPAAGSYWYDTTSGLFGNAGASSAGFMRAGHDFGPLDAHASNGNTGVFLNGREFAYDEYVFFSMLAGTPIAAGRYWLNARGDVGFEGLDTAVGNLYLAVQQQRQTGGSAPNGRGDNFWWTRFSAGNCNEDNSAGYVALPDGGFASYGM